MKDKELLLKLNSLKSIIPDKEWKSSSREILYSQISNSTASLYKKDEVKEGFFIMWPRKMARIFSQPAFAVFLVIFLIASGALASAKIAQKSTPGDSLYIARVISEGAQLAITFNDTQKTKLNIKFANDRAKDITQTLKESEFKSEKEIAQKENLVKSFRKEINSVKAELQGASGVNKNLTATGLQNDEVQVFGANLGKDEKGMQVLEPDKKPFSPAEEVAIEAGGADEPKEEAVEKTPEPENLSDLKNAQQKLEEAEVLFNKDDYGAALDKLEEIGVIIKDTGEFDSPNTEQGEVKGVSEEVTPVADNK